ncbi:MAG: hypothetical protein V1872_10685, partial [bacterium]
MRIKSGLKKIIIGLLSLAFCVSMSCPCFANKPFINAHTSGAISRDSSIKVIFVDNIVDKEQLNKPLKESPFSFSPKIDGTALWTAANTLIFQPKDQLPAGEKYLAKLNTKKLVNNTDVPENLEFHFSIIVQSMELSIDGLEAVNQNDLKRLKLIGKITTADTVTDDNLKKILTAKQKDKGLSINWSHSEDKRNHIFTIEDIVRGDKPSEVILSWNGKYIGVDQKETKSIGILPLGPFKILAARAICGEVKYIEIRFSDPLKKDQYLEGIIRANGYTNLRFDIDRNIIRVYSSEIWREKVQLEIDPLVTNILGKNLGQRESLEVNFEEVKPAVRFAGKGVILPSTQGLTIPIETVNLRKVIVKAFHIHDSNICQFLQVNPIDGDRELQRVGRIVWKKNITKSYGIRPKSSPSRSTTVA